MPSIFLQPYPRNTSFKKLILTGIFLGTFVFLFLLFFKPFGLSESKRPDLTYILSGYGLVTSLTLIIQGLIFPWLFRSYFKEENWIVLKEIIQTLLVIFLIGIGNLLYSYWLGMFRLSFKAFLSIQFFTFIIALLPVTILVMFQQIRLLKKNIEETKKLSGEIFKTSGDSSKMVHFSVHLLAENEKDLFTAPSQHVFYIMAADNYIEIVFSENQEIKKTLLRSSLKRSQAQLIKLQGFYRCHRTCIVNLSKVKSITGNAQGYKLILKELEEEIPVSRNLNKEIVSVLKDFNS